MSTTRPDRAPVRVRLAVLLALQCTVVLVCVLATTLVAISVQERSIRAATEERVLDVATSLVELDQVQRAVLLDTAAATAELQPLADVVAAASGVDYVVVTDARGIRLTHPNPAERGRTVSTDATAVLAGETFLGTETGTIGPSLRAKVPVRSLGGEVVGTASVGVLESEISGSYEEAVGGLLPWVAGSIVLGVVLSGLLTAALRRRVRRLEADARELDTQRRISGALRDQTHEFHTRLHVIRGLVAEGETGEALTYIGGLAPVASGLPIDDPALRALLDGLAAELPGLRVDPASLVPRGTVDDDVLTVLGNLVRNAAEASGPSGRIDVLVLAGDERVTIDVADDGPGVAPADAARIFDRGVSSKAAAGRGVGLDLVRRIAGARGGSVTVGRSAAGGARFTVELPHAGVRA
ncbi:signal transduction histidine kinase regulating citrate/malate metabolism [Microbacterium testaceum StLB037]|uniref:histidine kinase n=1 Tax=Microbacterium testaceum (strain StLB037) TaxID=979556 RepID=E8NFB8_MICTS|nr:ATP-binding protein [Microbacterium testaceum]BAJ75191.1 signal transduction histidine kinase regulating citrate/malate metabolism [Microbacterium testaceum StLB037]